MKTDLERFIDLYKSFGIDCVVNQLEGSYYVALVKSYDRDNPKDTYSDKFIGYDYFNTTIHFNHEGKFVEQGFWE